MLALGRRAQPLWGAGRSWGCVAGEGVLRAPAVRGTVAGAAGARPGRALLWQKRGLAVRRGVQRPGAQPWEGGEGVVRFGGEGAKGSEAATAPGTLLRAAGSRSSVAGGEHPHRRSPRATLPLGSGLCGARSGGAGPGPRSRASSGSGRSPPCSRRCRPGTGARGRPPRRTR